MEYMKIIKYLIVPMMFGVVKGDANHTLACCPAGYYVIPRNNSCWEPKKNITSSNSLTCKNVIRLSKFSVNPTGQLEVPLVENYYTQVFEPNTFCVNNGTTIKDVNFTQIKPIAVLCITTEEETSIISESILGYCMIVSVIFLAITAIIYAALPELRDLQGKSIVNFCSSLAIGLAILSIMKLMVYSNMDLCAVRGFLVYFFLIAGFFWTNAISIQVLKSTRKPSFVDPGWKVFAWYALYAWGCSAILTICMAIVNYYPGNHQRPGIGHSHCWFFNKKQQWYYMYSVMSILIAANIGIFIYTSTIIWRSKFSSSHIKAVKFKLVMTIRLIILMGLPWIFEMIGSLSNKHIIWVVLDVFNTLQGLLIFLLLVVFRRRVVKVMYKHGWLDCVSGQVEKCLAVGNDDEENVVEHTDLPMNDRA